MIYIISGIILGIILEVVPISIGIFGMYFYQKEYQKKGYEEVKEADLTRKIAKAIDTIVSSGFWMVLVVELFPGINYLVNLYLIKNLLKDETLIEMINDDVKRGVLRKIEDKNEQTIEVQVKNDSYRIPVAYDQLSPDEQKKFLMEELAKLIDDHSPEQPKKLLKK